MNKEKIILDLCGGTGSWAKPYKDNGYDVRTITLPDFDVELLASIVTGWGHISINDKDHDRYYEIKKLIQSNSIYGILAAPPCTMFSIARNDTTAKKKRDLRKGMNTVQDSMTRQKTLLQTQRGRSFPLKKN